MASREEEKRRRREEREARMRAEQAKAARSKRLQIVLGTVLVLAILAGGAVALLSSGGDDESRADDGPDRTVSIPQGGPTDLKQAAEEAGCEVRTFPSEGRGHTEDEVDYKTNPPTSGSHNPVAAQDGLYDPGNEPDVGNWVHSLEHGRVIFQYKKGTPRPIVDQLETLASEPLNGANGYHTIVMQNNTDMPHAVAAVAWTRALTCERMGPKFFAAARAFRKEYTDKAPEFIP